MCSTSPSNRVEPAPESYFALTQQSGPTQSGHTQSGPTGAATWVADARPNTAGPWHPNVQHAGPPSALAVHVAEEAVLAATGRQDLTALRFSAELSRPLPVARLQVSTTVERVGRASALVSVSITDQHDKQCLNARVLFLQTADTAHVASTPLTTEAAPPEDCPPMTHSGFGYAESIEWRTVRGGLLEPGPGRVWTRPGTTVADGVPLSSLQRVVLVGDSASGVSAELDWNTWSFVNADLDVHLLRAVEGDWILLDARSQIGPSGAGLARSTLFDSAGAVGATAQLLAVSPRT